MTVTSTILDQLGGNKFMVMTGASHPVKLENGIEFNLPRAKNGANRFKIVLTRGDLYDITFSKSLPLRMDLKSGELKGGLKEIEVIRSVFVSDLRSIFENRTGLLTSL